MHKIFENEKELLTIFELLNFQAKLVGGCVRDYIKYNKLVDDIDIATEHTPEVVMNKLSKKFNTLPIGLKHGTITIVGKKRKYEITTLREDILTNGRHANVNYNNVTYFDDASRRDFTINAIYLDVEGNFFDYFNSINDLKNNLVKFINNPKNRILEDHLRIMRFFRFATRFGNYDGESLNACYELMHTLSKISLERITSEWLQIIENEHFEKMFHLLTPLINELNLKQAIIPSYYSKLSLLGKLFLFYGSNSKLILSNKQKKYLSNLETIEIPTKAHALYFFSQLGNEFMQDLMLIKNTYFELTEIPAMPVNGYDLLNKGICGTIIKEKLFKLNLVWHEQYPNITKEQLLELI